MSAAVRSPRSRLWAKLTEIRELSGHHALAAASHRTTISTLLQVEVDIRSGLPASARCRLAGLRNAMEDLDVFVARREGRRLLLEALVLADEVESDARSFRIPLPPAIVTPVVQMIHAVRR